MRQRGRHRRAWAAAIAVLLGCGGAQPTPDSAPTASEADAAPVADTPPPPQADTTPPDRCLGAPACEDEDPCTVDECLAGAGCTHTPRAEGAGCDAGNPCLTGSTCQGGACAGGAAVECPTTAGPCVIATCDPARGGCVEDVLPFGATCDDGEVCTLASQCEGEECVGTADMPCDDGDACTVDTCAPVVGCTSSPGPPCDDGQPCTDDACAPDSGCVHAPVAAPCDDGDACTTGDTCVDGECVAGDTEVVCDDGNGCTLDSCDPASGACVHLPGGDLGCVPPGSVTSCALTTAHDGDVVEHAFTPDECGGEAPPPDGWALLSAIVAHDATVPGGVAHLRGWLLRHGEAAGLRARLVSPGTKQLEIGVLYVAADPTEVVVCTHPISPLTAAFAPQHSHAFTPGECGGAEPPSGWFAFPTRAYHCSSVIKSLVLSATAPPTLQLSDSGVAVDNECPYDAGLQVLFLSPALPALAGARRCTVIDPAFDSGGDTAGPHTLSFAAEDCGGALPGIHHAGAFAGFAAGAGTDYGVSGWEVLDPGDPEGPGVRWHGPPLGPGLHVDIIYVRTE